MGVIAWIFLGLATGLLASQLIPGRRAHGAALTCAIGTAGALLGGWTAAGLLRIQTLNTFFSLQGWLMAVIGAAILLLACRSLSGRSGPVSHHRDGIPVPVPVPVRRRDAPR